MSNRAVRPTLPLLSSLLDTVLAAAFASVAAPAVRAPATPAKQH